MAVDFLTLLSPTWQKKVKQTASRKGLIAACLTDEYELPHGGADTVIETLRRSGYDEDINRSKVYEDRDAFRKAYRYFRGDAKVAQEVEANREKIKDSALMGIFSLLHDHPEIQAWEDVEENLRAIPASLPPPATSMPATPATREEKTFDGMFPPPQGLDQTLEGIVGSLQKFRMNLQTSFSILQEEARRLKQENVALRARLGEYVRVESGAQDVVTLVKTALSDLAEFISIEGCGLPSHTTMSGTKGGWTREFAIIYSDDFQKRFFGDYLETHERAHVVKALNNFAKEGRFYPGLNTKKFVRRLPGVPPGTRGYHYSRASDDIRFTWKQSEGGVITVFNAHKHNEVEQ